ncbi:2-nitropropane dioxygenase [Paraphaeosphaeria sporulosa]
MAASDSDYNPSTPPPAPAKRTRKRTAKALETETLQQLPTTRAAAQPNDDPGSTQQHRAQDELPPSVSLSLGRAPERGSTGIGELAVLIASLKETITQQSNIIANQNKIIEDIRSDRATFQPEQQHLKDQIAELHAQRPDVLDVQGTDSGGHGLIQGADLIVLLPEVSDNVQHMCKEGGNHQPILIAAGGIAEARSAAAALALGASGVVLGTRFLASHEANISKGYKDEILRASDGGQSTVRTKVYDGLRLTTGWAETYNARGVIDKSYIDAIAGMDEEENKKLYEEEMKKVMRVGILSHG